MGIGKTFYMDCDKCESELTDRDGLRTAGRESDLVEFADMAGWKYLDAKDGCFPGWYCGACVSEKCRKSAREAGRIGR